VMAVPSERWRFVRGVQERELVSPWVHCFVEDVVELFDLKSIILDICQAKYSLPYYRVLDLWRQLGCRTFWAL
jgi:hypothetical protein